MTTNIKLRVTPEQSEGVQKICFANNIGWGDELELNYLDAPCLFIDHRWLSHSHDIKFYNVQDEEEIDADLFIRTNGTCIESTDIVDNSSNNKSKEDIFKQYGFEVPDFECEILKYFEYDNTLVGYYKTKDGTVYAESWHSLNGRADSGDNKYDMQVHLTPIKKPWYETCKFPCVIMANYCMPVVVNYYYHGYVYDFRDNRYCVKTWRLLTNTEIEGLKQ